MHCCVAQVLFALNAGLYFLHHPAIPRIMDVCMQPGAVIFGGELYRALLSPFFHASDMHVYFNMTSLVHKVQQHRRLPH